MFSDRLSTIHFWGWQLIIVLAALTLPLGFTTSKEYAELEWPIDIADHAASGSCSAGTCSARCCKRRERHMYVSIWFYLATFITVALLHVVNSLELPVSLLKSYSMYAGVQDALVQWWYGHNAVAFFLTTPFLGVMYYFIPKAANRPVFSYRLSIVHFWSLIFLYIWAGPHHLLYTALPDWAQSLGTVFSVMLIAPSWGGMVNGLLTLRGAWDRVRERPGAQVHGRRRHRLRHGDVRRADDVAQERQRAHALHRLHHRRTSTSARSPGTAAWRSRCSTTSSRASTARSCTRCGWPTCTSGWRRSASCSTPFRCTSAASRRA